jgi:hypothetical protein
MSKIALRADLRPADRAGRAAHRAVPRSDVRAIFETALDMVDTVDVGTPGGRPQGVQAARVWLQQLLDATCRRPSRREAEA